MTCFWHAATLPAGPVARLPPTVDECRLWWRPVPGRPARRAERAGHGGTEPSCHPGRGGCIAWVAWAWGLPVRALGPSVATAVAMPSVGRPDGPLAKHSARRTRHAAVLAAGAVVRAQRVRSGLRQPGLLHRTIHGRKCPGRRHARRPAAARHHSAHRDLGHLERTARHGYARIQLPGEPRQAWVLDREQLAAHRARTTEYQLLP